MSTPTRLPLVLALLLAAGSVATFAAAPTPARAQAASTGDGLAPPGVGPFTWTTEDTAFDTLTGPDGDIPVTLDARLYIPDGASAENPVPAMYVMPGFGVGIDGGEVRTLGAYFAGHGYLVATVDHQGFHGSGGCLSLDHRDYDNRSARQVIDWIAEQPYVAMEAPGDPQLGFIGGSYGGGYQGHTAIDDPRVDAISPGRTWLDLAYSLDPNNYVPDRADPYALDTGEQGVFKRGWTSLFFALGSAGWAQGQGGCDPVSRALVYPTATPCPGWIPGVCDIQARLQTTGNADAAGIALIEGTSLNTILDQLTTPTLIPQGLPDTLFNVNETIPTLQSLQKRGVPVAVFWHSSGHGGHTPAPGDGEAYGGGFDDSPAQQERFAKGYFARRSLNWMERYVRGLADVDTGPAFAYFRNWIEYDTETGDPSSVDAYGTADTYPPADVEELALTLDPASMTLALPGTAVTGGTASFTNPPGGSPGAYSEVPNFSGPGGTGDRPAEEIDGLHVAFDTPPLVEAVEWMGIPFLDANLTHANPLVDLRVFLKLYDISPDGTATLIRRQVAPSRVPTSALGDTVTLRGIGNVWRFEPGHRIRLVLASTDTVFFTEPQPDQLTISSSPAAPSVLRLPVIPTSVTGAPAPTPEPAPAPISPLPTTGGGLALTGLAVLVAARRRHRTSR